MGCIVREASDPRTRRVLTPAPVERLWRNTGLIHELSMFSIDRYSFMSRVCLGQRFLPKTKIGNMSRFHELILDGNGASVKCRLQMADAQDNNIFFNRS